MDHKTYCLTHVLLPFIDYEKEFNGFTDSRQVIVWKVDGEDILRSEGGQVTATTKFKELALRVIEERYGDVVESGVPAKLREIPQGMDANL